MLRTQFGHGVADGSEVVDQSNFVQAQFFADHAGANDPRIVGHLENFAAHWAGDRNGGGARQRAAELGGKGFPGGLQAGVFGAF